MVEASKSSDAVSAMSPVGLEESDLVGEGRFGVSPGGMRPAATGLIVRDTNSAKRKARLVCGTSLAQMLV